MDGKKYLSEIRALRIMTQVRRSQADEIVKLISILRECHGTPESIRALDRIRAGALKLADQYEAECREHAACIDRLPDPASSVLRLYWVDGLSLLQIADRLNYSESHIRRVHSKAVKKLDSMAGNPNGLRKNSERIGRNSW